MTENLSALLEKEAREWLDELSRFDLEKSDECSEKYGCQARMGGTNVGDFVEYEAVVKAAAEFAHSRVQEALRRRKSNIPESMIYRSLQRLSLAIAECAGIGFEESSPTTNDHHASIWNDLNDAQKDAALKLKHYRQFVNDETDPVQEALRKEREEIAAIIRRRANDIKKSYILADQNDVFSVLESQARNILARKGE